MMKAFIRKHERKLIVGHGIGIIILLISSMLATSDSAAKFYFGHQGDARVARNETTTIDVLLRTDTSMNAAGASLVIPAGFEIIAIDKTDSVLDLWTEEKIDRDAGRIRFSGGTLKKDGLRGDLRLLSLVLRAKTTGESEFLFESTEVFASDGQGTVIKSEGTPFPFVIFDTVGGSSSGSPLSEPSPSDAPADLNGDGAVTLVDLSIMAVRLFGPYSASYDVNKDGSLSFSDLTALFSRF